MKMSPKTSEHGLPVNYHIDTMKKVTITLNDDIWEWWKNNSWINLSQLAEKELKRLKILEERVLGTCPECGSPKLRFDGKTYKCGKCGYVYK
jgi:ribosomal protein S27AE